MTKEWIPNIDLGQDYDSKYKDETVHFDKLGKLADFFGRDMPMHLHAEYCQIHLVQAGKTFFNIDQNTYETQGSALFFTPSSTPHAFWTEPNAPGFVLTMHASVLASITDRLQAFNNIFFLPIVIEERHTTQAAWRKIEQIFDLLKYEWIGQSKLHSEAIEAILQLLIIHLLRLSGSQHPRYQNNQAEILSFRAFSRLVETHFVDERRITFYCDQLKINESRLNYICNKITDTSPKKIINGRIILDAKRLLSHTNMNLTEISYTLGFMDPSYFSRFFYKNTQSTPTEFRNEHRKD
ncbi:helix-turn-helix domain-containing protein [Marinomonas gallaica]|uniref:helix-turn-helix domain-containing protein n=1 Tax=Marinomonas gallaica TaxID=1806667 RepID=UPI003A934550